jgi:parvulin-like peptidyl-prolyl isomerase
VQRHTSAQRRPARPDPSRLPRAIAVTLLCLLISACGAISGPTPLVVGPGDSSDASLEPGVGAPYAPASISAGGPPVATVDGVGINRQEWADRVQLIRFRFARERVRLQNAIDAGTVDQADAQDQLLELASKAASAEAVAVDDLIDLALKAKLAHDEGLSITPAEVDAAQAAETKGDPTFIAELAKTVSAEAYRRNLEGEVLAQKLRDAVVRKATADSVEQVKLSEIVLHSLEGPDAPSDTGGVHASWIMYAPNDDMDAALSLATDDPAWAQAQAQAQKTADALRAIADVKQRSDRFAQVARTESDDAATSDDGGDLTWLTPDQVEDAVAGPLFDETHQPGDVIGPVLTESGWAVLLYIEKRPPLADRIATVQQRLAQPGADFAAIARELSDGDEAPNGGDLGWLATFEADPQLEAALTDAHVGTVVGPLTQDDGVHFYRVDAREFRSLDPDQRQSLQETAFDDWYLARRDQAFADGRVTIAEDSPPADSALPGDTSEPSATNR